MIQVWYHANCNDGLAAAAVCFSRFRNKFHDGTDVKYVAVSYGETPPEYQIGDEIFIVDFSYKKEVILQIAEVVSNLTVLDHHKTAEAELINLPHVRGLVIHFDMEKSGARLAWEHLYTEPCPRFIELIEDRDLWRFRYLNTNNLYAGMQLVEKSPEVWAKYLNDDNLSKSAMMDGTVINQYRTMLIQEYVNRAELGDLIGPGADGKVFKWNVPIVNCPKDLASDVGEGLCKRFPNACCSLTYEDIKGKRTFSLRSGKPDTGSADFDVSAVAKYHGGGGHKHAAGFTKLLSGIV